MVNRNSRYGDLFQRVVVHSTILIFLIVLLYSSLFPITSLALGLVAALCGAVATHEYASMAKLKHHYPFQFFSAIGSFIFILMSFFAIRWNSILPDYTLTFSWIFLYVWLIISIFRSRRHECGPLQASGISLFSVLYVAIPVRLFLHILYGFVSTEVPFLGVWWACFLIATTKGADIFGYFFGKAFGSKRISPEISPNKTVVGFISGCLGSVLISWLFFLNIPAHFASNISMPHVIVPLGLTLGIASFFGDITESLFKRDAKIKDSGIIKSIGGMLDILDSLLLSTPIVYTILLITQQGKFVG